MQERLANVWVNRLSVCNKLCYAVGGAPYQITGCALGFFLQIYLLDVAQLDPFYASVILFVGRAWDAVTDPTVGFLVSRSPWTRFGRMIPWIIVSTPLAVISYFLIWYVPNIETGKVIWYLIWYCLFQTMQTCFHVPYSALTMFISSEQKERDSATAYRMTVEVLGTVIGTGIQGQIVGRANAPCFNSSLYSPDSNGNVSQHFIANQSTGITLTHTRQAYMIASGVICIIYVLCALVLSLGLSATLTIPFWQWFLTRFGKKTAVFCGTSFVVPFLILVVCVEHSLVVTYIVSFVAGVSVAAAFLLPWSMLPDVVDDFEVQNPDSHGHEAIFYSFYVFFTKFASGVSLGVSTLSLDFAGYITNGCTQPDEVHLTLKILVAAAPVFFILIGLIIFITYPINEERRQGNRKLLQELR
uniref:Uncharacterized protein n=1 Tax=Denticeps clupeoides TaxID=299321 RepID=A0AAY4DA21_9TELE